MLSATRYMRSRHDQKSSLACSRLSARPANARWKAWLWASTSPGSTGPVSTVVPAGGTATPGVTSAQQPCASTRSSTASCQPPATQARGAHSALWDSGIGPPGKQRVHQFAQHGLDGARAHRVEREGRLLAHVATPAFLELH